MKRFYTLCMCLLTTVLFVDAQTVIVDSAALEAGYVNDVYYSIPSYTKYPAISDWDIALSSQPSNPPTETVQSTTIRVNGGRGVQLFKITNVDVNSFNTVILSTDSANWQPLFDSPTNWDFGGTYFTHYTSNPFDYGWGEYDLSSHDVIGDSVYAIRTLNGSWKKLMVNKLAFDTAWFITVADLDNNNLVTSEINKQAAAGKNFVYVNLNSASVMDKEPVSWDMMFTRYVEMVPGPGGVMTPYPVNGVLINKGVTAYRAYPVDVSNVNYNDYASMMSNNINTIGYNWKSYNFSTMEYDIADSMVYFIHATDDNIYKLRFTAFHGSNVESVFELSEVALSVNDVTSASNILLYPNPSSNALVVVDFDAASNEQYRITDATGRTIALGDINSTQNVIDVSAMSNGLYVFQLIKNNTVQTKSFVVNR